MVSVGQLTGVSTQNPDHAIAALGYKFLNDSIVSRA